MRSGIPRQNHFRRPAAWPYPTSGPALMILSMLPATFEERRRDEQLPREELAAWQLQRVNQLLDRILPANAFYRAKLGDRPRRLTSLAQLSELPFTTKQELMPQGSAGDYARNQTFPLEQYVRFHRTSGTRGRPLAVADTAEDWAAWIAQWQYVLDAAGIQRGDRVVCAFSFGPFIGFWSAFEACIARGVMTIPGGGMSSRARLELLRDVDATAVLCTPSYALHLAEVARQSGLEPGSGNLRTLIVAGEPGGSLPSVRRRIETAWNARVVDHAGATEVGPWGYPDPAGRGLFVNERSYIAEVLEPGGEKTVDEGQLGELVLTTLDRVGAPVVRYRTGDLVRPRWKHSQRTRFVWLEGGVVGRADEMLIIRGVNLFPSSLDEIIRGFPEIAEYRAIVSSRGELDTLRIEIEGDATSVERLATALQVRLGLHIDVALVPAGSLPRFEGKGRRLSDERNHS